MTTETPWLTGPSDEDSPNAETDPFLSLGLGFTEEYPAIDTAPVDHVPGSALMSLPAAVSTELVPVSRRALRDAERALPATRRADRDAARRPSSPRDARAAAVPVSHPTSGLTLAVAPPTPQATLALAPHASRVPLARRITKKAFPPVVMLVAASLLVGTSVPANALFDPQLKPLSAALSSMPAEKTMVVELKDQVIEAEAANDLSAATAARDEWGVTSYAEMVRLRYGSNNYSYSTSGSGAIRWPFAFAAPITSAFGDRAAPCRGCSSYHRGLDFDAGYGAPIGALADGIVTAVGRSAAYGYRVEIEHVINGQKVMTLYAHMIDDSSALTVGAPVVAGEVVGALGSTGLSTGPHLHLEVRLDGVPVDPFAWLMANAS